MRFSKPRFFVIIKHSNILTFSQNNLNKYAAAQQAEKTYMGRMKKFARTQLQNVLGTGDTPINEPDTPASLFADMALESLYLQATNLIQVGRLASSQTLKVVDIGYNKISGEEILHLASNLSIKSLGLAWCGLDIFFLPRLAKVNPTLNTLNFSGNNQPEDQFT